MIRTPNVRTFIPFRDIASMDRGRAYTTIERRNGRRVVQVSADVTPRSRAPEVLADVSENVLPVIDAPLSGPDIQL
jgi:multidrug efflux pump subunit AcrB